MAPSRDNRTTVVCLLAMALRTAAISPDSPWGGYGLPGGGLKIDAADDKWKKAVSESNASSTYTLPGRDVSKPWPASPIDGWKLSLTAVDLTPDEVGYDLKIIAPEALYKKDTSSDHSLPGSGIKDHGNGQIVDTNDDWVMCSWLNFGPEYNDPSKALNPKDLEAKPDGDCSPWLSKECIAGIEKQAQTAYSLQTKAGDPYNTSATCGNIDVPQECKGTGLVYLNGNLGNPSLPIRFLDDQTTYQGGWNIRDGQDTPLKDAPLMWKSLTRDYIAIITMFGHYNKDSSSAVDAGFAKLSCIRPQGKTNSGSPPGSTTQSADPSTKSATSSDNTSKSASGAESDSTTLVSTTVVKTSSDVTSQISTDSPSQTSTNRSAPTGGISGQTSENTPAQTTGGQAGKPSNTPNDGGAPLSVPRVLLGAWVVSVLAMMG